MSSSVALHTLRPCLAAAIQKSSTRPCFPEVGSDPSVGSVYLCESNHGYTPPPVVNSWSGGASGGPQTGQAGMIQSSHDPEYEKDREIDRLKRELKKAEEKSNFYRNQVMQLQDQVSCRDSRSSSSKSAEVEQLRTEILEERSRGHALQVQLEQVHGHNGSDPVTMQARITELEQMIASARAAAESSSRNVHSQNRGSYDSSSPANPHLSSPLNCGDDLLDPTRHPGGSRRAVVIGCNYPGQLGTLRAGGGDAQHWARYFTKRCNFADGDIRLLSDDPAYYHQKERPDSAVPSRANILRALQWLTARSSSDDQLFFVFCGHGVQVLAEEFAGRKLCENAIAPTDVAADGSQPRVVSDTDVHKALLAVPSGAFATLIYDCCHGGNPLDRSGLNYLTEHVNRGKVDYEKLKGHPVLPRFLEFQQWKVRPNPPEASRESNLRCQAVQWSACSNAQFCVELPIDDRARGVFTYMFICALLKLGNQASNANLLAEVNSLTKQLKGRWRLQQDVCLSSCLAASDSRPFLKL